MTCTTRAPRPGEVDGVDYQFLTRDAVPRAARRRRLLEANEVHGNWYGTPAPRGPRGARRAGHDVILKIDVQGAQVVKEQVPEALLIFLVPPSLEALFQRLRSRATETADELEIRQRNAAIELARQDDYDHVVVNETGQVARTAAEIDEIIEQEKRRNPDRRIADLDARRPPCRRRTARRPRTPAMGRSRTRARRGRASTRPAAAGPPDLHLPRARATLADARGRRGGPRRVRQGGRQALGIVLGRARGAPTGDGRTLQADRGAGPRRRPAAAAARAGAGATGSPTTTSRRRRWSSGRCCRRGCSSASSSSRSVTPAGERAAARSRTAGLPRWSCDLLDELAAGRARSATCPAPEGRAGLLRRLRALAASRARRRSTGRCSAPAPGRATSAGSWLTAGGRAAAAALAAGSGRRAGRSGRARARAARPSLAAGPPRRRDAAASPRAGLAERHGPRPSPASSGAASSSVEVRERPRRPLADRPAGLRGARPPGARAHARTRRRRVALVARRPSTPATRRRSCSTA